MVGQVILGIACALGLTMGTINTSIAQPASAQPPAIERWADDFTVLTMAPDGAWGTATDVYVNGAINRAIKSCKEMSEQADRLRRLYDDGSRRLELRYPMWARNDPCRGARFGGSGTAALMREAELRYTYSRNMPPCRRIVTVDPNGNAVVDPNGNAVREGTG